ncbi:MAG TPA: T9SS type A sorting domain-containing protein [Candidatus Eisenbacteria bacterium]|jgi:hypothetical protein|nr:T9SS type A sorting domain-containing protein [Candidatus Eisenbacteria bacterium]
MIVVFMIFASSPSYGQYMYLDSNGDGLSDNSDQLRPLNEPTLVDIYVVTDSNSDGSPASCDNGEGALTINSYVVNLSAEGGDVAYSNFSTIDSTMTVPFGELNTGNGKYKNGAGGTSFHQPGKYRVATLTITAIAGDPSVSVVPVIEGSHDFTSFGTACYGQELANTYTLSVDWFDTGGLWPQDPLPYSMPEATLSDAPQDSIATALPTSPPAPGGTHTGLQYCRVKLPRPGFRVVAKYFDASCGAIGGLCETQVYQAGMDSCAWVPIVYAISPFEYIYWDKVRIESPCITPWGFFERDLQSPVELFPDSHAEDRLNHLTLSYPPDEITVLDMLQKIQSASQTVFRDSRASIQVNWSSFIAYSVYDEIHIPDPGWFVAAYGPYNALNKMRSSLAHEYGHALFYKYFGGSVLCTTEPHNPWEWVIADCVSHDGCNTGLSYQGGFSEGWAEAYSIVIGRTIGGIRLGDPWPTTCWQDNPSNPNMFGSDKDGNVAPLLYHAMSLDARSVFNTLIHGMIAEVGGQTHLATTLTQFRSLWQDTNLETNRFIGVHAPGSFNMDGLYKYYILGPTTTAVGLADSLPPEYEEVQWIRRVFPTPVRPNSTLTVRAIVPSSGQVRLSVFSSSGRMLATKLYSGLTLGEQNFSFPLTNLATGVYFLRFEDAGNHRAEDSAKFIILK